MAITDDLNQEYEEIRFSIVPDFILRKSNISWGQKLMFGEIVGLSLQMGYCYASNKYFSMRYGIDISTVSRWISKLESCGLIIRKLIFNQNSKEVKERRIFINSEKLEIKQFLKLYMQNCTEGIGKNATTPPCKKVKVNNKYLNNICLNNLETKRNNVFLTTDEHKILLKKFGQKKFDSGLENYSLWKLKISAHPKSDFVSLTKWLSKTKNYRHRSSAVNEAGVDDLSNKDLTDLPF